jgi:hypothetical protein
MRAALFVVVISACAPTAQPRVDAAALRPCVELQLETGAREAGECRLDASGEVLHVVFAETAENAEGGTVTVEVLNDRGAVAQVLSEENVSEYIVPHVEDVDGDGHGDVLIARESGNVNTAWGVWIFNREHARYERAGEVSGVEFRRTSEGYIAVPARSSAAAWAVNFYRLDQAGLVPLVGLYIEATDVTADGRVTGQTCAIEDAPGLAQLNLTMETARARFCAEPAAQVFGS